MSADQRVPIPMPERAIANAALLRLHRLVPPVEDIYTRDWGPDWRTRLSMEIGDAAGNLHDERRLLKAIAATGPPLRLFPRHTADDFRRLYRIANDAFHNDGRAWESDTAHQVEQMVESLLQAAFPTRLVVVAVPNGHTEIWRCQGDDIVEHRWLLDGRWSEWTTFESPPCTAFTAVSFGQGHMEVFLIDNANQAHHRWWLLDVRHPNGKWFDWRPFLPGQRVSGPLTATSQREGHIIVVARSLDGEPVACHRDGSGEWHGWDHF